MAKRVGKKGIFLGKMFASRHHSNLNGATVIKTNLEVGCKDFNVNNIFNLVGC